MVPYFHWRRGPSRALFGPRGGFRAALLPVALLAACSGDSPTGPPRPVVPVPTSVTVSPASAALASLGETVKLTAAVRDQNGAAMPGAEVTWSSSAATVAAVDGTGLVTAAANGDATVTATAGTASGSAAVTVAQVANAISIDPSSLVFVEIGDTATLTAIVADANGHTIEKAVLAWSSGDPSVAWVDSAGLVTAVAVGSTEVTATSDSAAASSEVDVTEIATDRDVLEHLFRTTSGENWTNSANWLTDAPLSAWHGIRTNQSGRVTDLSLRANNVSGQIPATLGHLDQLLILDLSQNPLTGPIPAEIEKLGRLRDLLLGISDIDGPLPPEMGGMRALRYLYIARTRLAGPVPETFANLDLDAFYFHGTQLCLPPSLEEWLATVQQRTSDPTPCIPPTPDREVLVTLYSSTSGPNWKRGRNWLGTGGINTWQDVETDEDGYVTELSIANNNLTGSIPPELGNLARLERLRMFNNELTGPIPPELGSLSRLEALRLSNNELEGRIPPELGKLTRLKALWLSDNELEGSIPPELGNVSSLEDLSLFRNHLSGPLPRELGRLAALHTMSFSNNQFSGTIPPEIGNLSSLKILNLSNNGLSGPIPGELGNLPALEYFALFENELTGEIPPEIGNLAKVRTIFLSDNNLTGPIPPEIGQLAALKNLNVGRNGLSGPIPPEIGNLSALERLSLFTNNLSGRLPSEIGNIRTLESLEIVRNPELNGLLPRSLLNLEALSSLWFWETGLCAQIDHEFQEWLQALPPAGLSECDIGEVERLALIDLHDLTDGPSWTNRGGWKSAGPVSSWHGITSRDGRVRELSLPDNGLQGPLPPEIANFTELEAVNLGGNDLAGELPRAFASLSELSEMRIGNNQRLEGVLPFDLTQLKHVGVLRYEGTGLCASPSATFQAWFTGIEHTAGAICGNPEQVALSLPVVYLTQSVQSPSRGVRLVANRQALLRVFVTGDQPRAFFEPSVVATFTHGGREVYRVTVEREGDQIATLADEGDLGRSYNAVIPAKHITPGVGLVVEVDPEGTVPRAPGSVIRFPASGSESLNVVDVPPMEVTVVPVLEAEEPDSSIFEWTRDISGSSPQVGLFRYAFPFSEFSAKSRETYVTSLDLTSGDGQWGLVLELEAVRAAENGQGYWYAAAASVNGYVRGVARLGAWVSMGKAWDTELAHEVGHNLDLLHAPCGGALGTEPDFPYPNGSIGVWGYDFRDGSVVSPERRRDIMGYCYERGWLSDFYFEKVLDYRERVEGGAARARLATPGQPSDMLVLWGGVVGGKPRIEPVFSMRAAARLPEGAGPYRLEGGGTGGQTAFSVDFTPGEDQFGNKYFFFTIPIEPGWRDSLDRITLTGPEGTVTVDTADERRLSVVTDRAGGKIRAILRDWDGVLPAALGRAADIRVVTTRGVGDAVRLRR